MQNVMNILSSLTDFPEIPKDIMHGDMPGDKIEINEGHKQKAKLIFPVLAQKLKKYMANNQYNRAVICVCGGALQKCGIGSYILSGDNYPHRIPAQNDAERVRVFRHGAVRGLVASGLYNENTKAILRELQANDTDSDPKLCTEYPWLETYQNEGKKALAGYLGTENEQNFAELSAIIKQFKTGANELYLKRMGRTELDLWYDLVDFSDKNVLIIEWTHGNSDKYIGVDIPILLNSTPQETLEHRRSRNRDGAVDSPFVTMVLEIEQRQLEAQAHKAQIIVSKSGELLTYSQYRKQMAEGGV